jgi:hypothetical protein
MSEVRKGPQIAPIRLHVNISTLTIFLSKLIGLFAILVSLCMVARKQTIVETVAILIRNGPLLLIVGMVRLVVGLAMVLGHNVWSGGALPVIVTLFGWIILIRSIPLLFLSPEAIGRLFKMLRFEELFYLYAGISFVLGLYLTYAGLSAGRWAHQGYYGIHHSSGRPGINPTAPANSLLNGAYLSGLASILRLREGSVFVVILELLRCN